MVNKNKNNQTSAIARAASHIGVIVMLSATVLNMAESVEHESQKVVSALQPNFTYATQLVEQTGSQNHGEQTSRGAKEEIPHASSNLSAARRSPFVSGTI